MSDRILEKKASVLVVDPSNLIRAEISKGLKLAGFSDIAKADNVSAAKRHLINKYADWVICSYQPGEKEAICALLDYLADTPRKRQVKLSLLIDDGDKKALSELFEKGLVSFHPKKFSAKDLQEAVKAFLTVYTEKKADVVETAAHYLREHLKNYNYYAEGIHFAQCLIAHDPETYDRLLELAWFQFKAEEPKEALDTLNRLFMLAPALDNKCHRMIQEFVGMDASDLNKKVLGIDHVVIIDQDEAVVELMRTNLEDIGIAKISSFDNPDAGLEFLAMNPSVDLVIHEWKLRGLAGPQLLQRIRALESHKFTPIIVASALVKKKDTAILNEMSVASLVSKPFGEKEFALAISFSMRQEMQPTEQRSLELKLLKLLNKNKVGEAKQLKSQWDALGGLPEGKRLYMDAEFAFHDGEYDQAQDLLKQSIRLGKSESLQAINLLGKCFLKQGNDTAAIQCFEKAQAMSPDNVERMCAIADIQIDQGDHDAAKESLEKASAIDKGNKKVATCQIKNALAGGEMDVAQEVIGGLDDCSEIARFSNNKAVTLIRSGSYKEGVELYKRTIGLIPSNQSSLAATVAYNLALAYARNDDLKKALKVLEQILQAKKKYRVSPKAGALTKKIKAALKSGEKLAFNDASTAEQTTPSEQLDLGDLEESINNAEEPPPAEPDPFAALDGPEVGPDHPFGLRDVYTASKSANLTNLTRSRQAQSA